MPGPITIEAVERLGQEDRVVEEHLEKFKSEKQKMTGVTQATATHISVHSGPAN